MGMVVSWRSCSSCQMSQCNALQSCSERGAWGSVGGVFGCSLELTDMRGDGQGVSRGAVRGHMVVAAEAAYTEGKAGNETMCRA